MQYWSLFARFCLLTVLPNVCLPEYHIKWLLTASALCLVFAFGFQFKVTAIWHFNILVTISSSVKTSQRDIYCVISVIKKIYSFANTVAFIFSSFLRVQFSFYNKANGAVVSGIGLQKGGSGSEHAGRRGPFALRSPLCLHEFPYDALETCITLAADSKLYVGVSVKRCLSICGSPVTD